MAANRSGRSLLSRMTTGRPAPRLLSALVGRYRLLRPLGRGGSGSVYEAEDTSLGRRVALKLLRHDRVDKVRSRALREAQLAGAVQHSHVVSLFETGVYPGGSYIAMELVQAKSAQTLLEQKPMAWRDATELLAAACAGFMAVHARGIIHCDIKPANLLVSGEIIGTGYAAVKTSLADLPTPHSPFPALKITDFGLARWLEPARNPPSWRRVSGTLHFMSPEQCREDECDERADIYSLGATYYTLLTRRPPYTVGTPLQIMFKHCSAPVADPRHINREIPSSCAKIVMRAMAKNRVDRFKSAHELQDALEEALLGR
jgi:serine/threonine protein kinase